MLILIDRHSLSHFTFDLIAAFVASPFPKLFCRVLGLIFKKPNLILPVIRDHLCTRSRAGQGGETSISLAVMPPHGLCPTVPALSHPSR